MYYVLITQAHMLHLYNNYVKPAKIHIVLKLYCIVCVEFASSEPVPGLNDGTLQLAFVDLRQVSHMTQWTQSRRLGSFFPRAPALS